MKRSISPTAITLFTMLIAIAATPGKAFASGSVHLDLPKLGIVFHNDHRYPRKKYRHSRRNNHFGYKSHRSPRYSSRHYKRHHNHYYYNDNYQYDRPRLRSRYRNQRDYQRRCPAFGYSTRYHQNHGCYRHNNHYHCDY